jgi:hypothetical protein
MSEIARGRRSVTTRLSRLVGALIVACALLIQPVTADDLPVTTEGPPANTEKFHPLLNSKYWIKAGAFFAARDLSLSANGTVFSGADLENAEIDFDSTTGLDDTSDLFIAEFGWHFGKKWDVAFQHFRSSRSAQRELSESFEWEDVVYEAGATIKAHSYLRITRLFFSRRFWDKGSHDLRLGAGLHLIDTGFSVSGEARLEDDTTEFQVNVVSAEFPFPDIGAWYRYSIDDRWLLHTRVDWLSASTDDFGGGILNASAGVDFALTRNIGIGFAYQFFEINGTIKEDTWRGELRTRYEGITLSIDGFW